MLFTSLSQDSCVSLVHLWRHSWSFAYWTPVLLSKPFVNTAHMVLMFTLHCTNLFTFHVFLLEHQVSVSQNAGCRTIIIQCPGDRCLFRQVIAGNMAFQKANNKEIHCWNRYYRFKNVCVWLKVLKTWSHEFYVQLSTTSVYFCFLGLCAPLVIPIHHYIAPLPVSLCLLRLSGKALMQSLSFPKEMSWTYEAYHQVKITLPILNQNSEQQLNIEILE